MAEAELQRLVDQARSQWEITDVTISHRLGRLEIGEVSVVVAVAAPHRGPALEACRWLIDTLKTEVPIFKKEFYAEGADWVEGCQQFGKGDQVRWLTSRHRAGVAQW